MKTVTLYKLTNEGKQSIVAVCRLNGEKVVCEGDEVLVRNLEQKGIRNYKSDTPQTLYPADGQVFLEQLEFNFKSGYLNATGVVEQPE